MSNTYELENGGLVTLAKGNDLTIRLELHRPLIGGTYSLAFLTPAEALAIANELGDRARRLLELRAPQE
jgi:hypothetical protein